MVNRGLVGCIAPHISEVGVGVIIKVGFSKQNQNHPINTKSFTNNSIGEASDPLVLTNVILVSIPSFMTSIPGKYTNGVNQAGINCGRLAGGLRGPSEFLRTERSTRVFSVGLRLS